MIFNIPTLEDIKDLKSAISKKQDLLTNPLTRSNITDNLTSTSTTNVLSANQGKVLNDAMTSLKKSVADGKSLVASAITNKGVSTASDASFQTMANNINSIESKPFDLLWTNPNPTSSVSGSGVTVLVPNISKYKSLLIIATNSPDIPDKLYSILPKYDDNKIAYIGFPYCDTVGSTSRIPMQVGITIRTSGSNTNYITFTNGKNSSGSGYGTRCILYQIYGIKDGNLP